MLKRMMQYLLIGTGIGAVTFLLNLALYDQVTLTRSEIISTLLMSAAIGGLSFLWYVFRPPYWLGLVLHYLATLGLVTVTSIYNHWIHSGPWTFVIMVTLIYVAITVGMYWSGLKDAKNVNELIRRRRGR